MKEDSGERQMSTSALTERSRHMRTCADHRASNYMTIALTTLALLLLFTIGHAAESKKGASPLQPKSTVVEQDETPPAPADPAVGEQIKWQVVSAGGGTCDSTTNYKLSGTVGQTAVGSGTMATCCNHDEIRGDVDYSGGSPNVGDVAYLVDYLFGGGPPPPCFQEGDADGDGKINVGDLSHLVDYLFGVPQGPAPLPCPEHRLTHGFWQSF